VVGAAGLAPLSISLLLAAVAVVLLGVVPGEEVYSLIEWRLLILIGGMTSVGLAMQKTGAAEWIAEHIVELALPFGLTAVLATFAVLAMVLTQPLSNAAAALVLLPVAISTAERLAVSPRPFAVMVTLAASLSFITPFEPACLLVYGPGRYRFIDFVKSGFVLSILSLVVLLVMVPRLWPL
jgi:di/tricarboxylate transporter